MRIILFGSILTMASLTAELGQCFNVAYNSFWYSQQRQHSYFLPFHCSYAASYLRVGFVPCLAPSSCLFLPFPLSFSLVHAQTPAFWFLWVTAICLYQAAHGRRAEPVASCKMSGDRSLWAQFLLDVADRIGPELVSVLCTWMHLLSKPVWLWLQDHERVKPATLHTMKICHLSTMRRGDAFVCTWETEWTCVGWLSLQSFHKFWFHFF